MVLTPLYIHAVKDKQDLKEACINHDEKWKNDNVNLTKKGLKR